MDVKEKALSTSTFTQWTANFVVAYIVPEQVKVLQAHGTFFFYAACLVVGVLLHFVVRSRDEGA